jgi:hypothetical protein
MPFTKQEVKEALENSTQIKEIPKWYLDKDDRIVFKPRGYNDMEFSIRVETLNSIHGMGWSVRDFYDGYVEIQKRPKTKAQKKIEEIKEIVE